MTQCLDVQTLGKQLNSKAQRQHEFIRLRAQGVSLKKAAAALNMSVGTLCEWHKQLELDIASARAIELEALQDEFFLLKEHRIRQLGELLKQLDGILSARDFSELDTTKLLDYRLKIFSELKMEFVATQPIVVPSGETKL